MTPRFTAYGGSSLRIRKKETRQLRRVKVPCHLMLAITIHEPPSKWAAVRVCQMWWDSCPSVSRYSPNLTLKNCAGAVGSGGVTINFAFTALLRSSTTTPLVIGEADSKPSTVSAA